MRREGQGGGGKERPRLLKHPSRKERTSAGHRSDVLEPTVTFGRWTVRSTGPTDERSNFDDWASIDWPAVERNVRRLTSRQERYATSRDTTVIGLRQPEAIDDPLGELAPKGARRSCASSVRQVQQNGHGCGCGCALWVTRQRYPQAWFTPLCGAPPFSALVDSPCSGSGALPASSRGFRQ